MPAFVLESAMNTSSQGLRQGAGARIIGLAVYTFGNQILILGVRGICADKTISALYTLVIPVGLNCNRNLHTSRAPFESQALGTS